MTCVSQETMAVGASAMTDEVGAVTHMCLPCASGNYGECENPELLPELQGAWIIPCVSKFAAEPFSIVKGKGQVGRPLLDPSEITDVTSTGRKRAAAIMPFLKGQVCGWAHLKHAGGGVVPILGCLGNTIADVKTTEEAHEKGADEVGHRHHGPDKNVLNNTPEVNLHGVCTPCHTRWHALNDPHYAEEGRPDDAAEPFTPVEPYFAHDNQTTFTDEEHALAEAWWNLPVKERGDYPFTPPDTARKLLPAAATSATLEPADNPWDDGDPFEIGDSE